MLVASGSWLSAETGNDCLVAVVNSAAEPMELSLSLRGKANWRFLDLLSQEEFFTAGSDGTLQLAMKPNQVRLLKNG